MPKFAYALFYFGLRAHIMTVKFTRRARADPGGTPSPPGQCGALHTLARPELTLTRTIAPRGKALAAPRTSLGQPEGHDLLMISEPTMGPSVCESAMRGVARARLTMVWKCGLSSVVVRCVRHFNT